MKKKFPPVDKKLLRKECLDARSAIAPEEAAAASESVTGWLGEMISGSVMVAGYCAVRGELDIYEAMAGLAAQGCGLCLPVVEAADRPLYFRQWHNGERLEKGRYDIDVPPADAAIVSPDIVLVPLVGFDRSGHRLGYGAGYYDRTIQRLRDMSKSVQIIGIAYSVQEVGVIPPEKHDEALDAVVTEKEILRFI